MKKLKWLIAASAAMLPTIAAAQTAQTTAGTVKGSTAGTVSSFLGIPYAAPPVGENRWRAPQPVAAWNGQREATAYAPDCAQAPFPPDAAPIRTKPSEDCLYLNVWKPTAAKEGASLPVMVWIHGGGFVNGGSSPAIYSGENFARDGAVFVSINYRLGRFGFFAHPGLATEGFGGNFGYLDQIAALQWVKANISKFGGDPGNVTVFGESAGGMSMHMLLQSPMARGLFHKVIIESGGGRERALPMPTIAQSAAAGVAFAPGLDAAALRALPAEQVTGDLSMMTMGKPGYAGPMVDGRTILGAGVDGAAAGIYAQVPVMVGANSADGFPRSTDKDVIFGAYGENEKEARALHDPDGKVGGLAVGVSTSADAMFIEPARAVARALAPRQPTYLFRFGYARPEFAAMGGAPHASELPYVFDTVDVRGNGGGMIKDPRPLTNEIKVATLTHRYWVSFARTGRPDAEGGVPAWPAATADDSKVQLIDASGASHVADPFTARLDFAERLATAKH
ncbi:carboxylesterase/lipase family protein [Novosphingobium taihuense]|uniref:Carboxylic ester hydrolase n=1 Tax=Novosphingobium taihuense TaxID=260085 RepID=A0A7W7ES55_9SPHN|nr:carboxylesterase family protein [Novosphingobium taihuense]MBB4611943.1 para-nitrobenzyl esterase [Novosphingobium taihuense]TWH88704.1 para-nitrobenzyl esterase [Novosphingobium taihuense]